jgi:hypothetical protein
MGRLPRLRPIYLSLLARCQTLRVPLLDRVHPSALPPPLDSAVAAAGARRFRRALLGGGGEHLPGDGGPGGGRRAGGGGPPHHLAGYWGHDLVSPRDSASLHAQSPTRGAHLIFSHAAVTTITPWPECGYSISLLLYPFFALHKCLATVP